MGAVVASVHCDCIATGRIMMAITTFIACNIVANAKYVVAWAAHILFTFLGFLYWQIDGRTGKELGKCNDDKWNPIDKS